MTFEHVDTLIAFAAVMLGISLLITVLTQMVSAFLGLRGTNLRWGITQLIKTVYPDYGQFAQEITDSVLRHPLISDSAVSKSESRFPLLRRWQLASHITVAELVGILEKMAAQTGKPDLKAAMQHIVQASAPEAPAAPIAVAQNLQFWFESAMDRAAQRFRLHMRVWTVVFAIMVAFGLHLDSLQLFNQLSSDARLRAGLVAASTSLSEKAQQVPPAGDYKAGLESLANQAKEIKSNLDKSSLSLIPDPYPIPWYISYAGKRHLFGVLFTTALLSLGAPFWFNALKSFSSLRPLLANKSDKSTGPAAA